MENKIDIRDLRVGNWVRITEPDNFAGATVRIHSLSSQEGAYFAVTVEDHEFGYFTRDVFCEDIEPIHLTKEILEKNGFEKIEDNYEYFSDEEGLEILFYPKSTNYTNGAYDYIDIERGCVSITEMPIEYVHQLQNLLRDLGIEKEITI